MQENRWKRLGFAFKLWRISHKRSAIHTSDRRPALDSISELLD
jgi:hypothetical protein